MRLLDLPVLDETRCTGCSDCVRLCPTDCLEMAARLPWLPRPVDCIRCELCVWICPVNALHLQPAGGVHSHPPHQPDKRE